MLCTSIIRGAWIASLKVRTPRQKITELCAEPGRAQRWSHTLAKQWMADEPQSASVTCWQRYT